MRKVINISHFETNVLSELNKETLTKYLEKVRLLTKLL